MFPADVGSVAKRSCLPYWESKQKLDPGFVGSGCYGVNSVDSTSSLFLSLTLRRQRPSGLRFAYERGSRKSRFSAVNRRFSFQEGRSIPHKRQTMPSMSQGGVDRIELPSR
jgi:hypothetical protein